MNTPFANDINPTQPQPVTFDSEIKAQKTALHVMKAMDEHKQEFGTIYISEFRREDIVTYEFIAIDPATREPLTVYEFDIQDHDEEAVAFIDAINRHVRPQSYSDIAFLALNTEKPVSKHLHLMVTVETEATGTTISSSHIEDLIVSFTKDGKGQWQNTAAEFVDVAVIANLAGQPDFYSSTVPETTTKIEDGELIKAMLATMRDINATYPVVKAPIIGQHAADSLKDDPAFMLSVFNDFPEFVSERDLSDTDQQSLKHTAADIKTYLSAKAQFFRPEVKPSIVTKPTLKH
ncbi:hypothetical protein AWB71_05285 [Caballeronia peredens]|nr:hypothetical protein AWB71_05285 [Caballeronia peredens]